jgi:hypothetical protein
LAANGQPAGVPRGRAVRCPPGAAAPARGAAQGSLRAAGVTRRARARAEEGGGRWLWPTVGLTGARRGWPPGCRCAARVRMGRPGASGKKDSGAFIVAGRTS